MSRLPAAKRKIQLLDTAARVFAARGYSGTTTAELAKEAGISEPIIYRHFASKRDLFVELIERTGQDTIEAWEASLGPVSDGAERLMRLVRSNPMVISQGGKVRYRVIVQAMTEVEDPVIQQALQRHIGRLHQFVMDEVVRAQESGLVSKRFSPELTAWALIQMGLGYGVLSALRVPGQGTDKAGNHVDSIIGIIMLGERYKQLEEKPREKKREDKPEA